MAGFLHVGYPTVEISLRAITTLTGDGESEGVDLVEVGMPYSDPVMDGVTIQRAGTKTLERGVRTRDTFAAVEAVARVGTPAVVMTYWNLIERYGAGAGMLLQIPDRFLRSKVPALYVLLYTRGRFWIDAVRIEPKSADLVDRIRRIPAQQLHRTDRFLVTLDPDHADQWHGSSCLAYRCLRASPDPNRSPCSSSITHGTASSLGSKRGDFELRTCHPMVRC